MCARNLFSLVVFIIVLPLLLLAFLFYYSLFSASLSLPASLRLFAVFPPFFFAIHRSLSLSASSRWSTSKPYGELRNWRMSISYKVLIKIELRTQQRKKKKTYGVETRYTAQARENIHTNNTKLFIVIRFFFTLNSNKTRTKKIFKVQAHTHKLFIDYIVREWKKEKAANIS